MVPARLLRLSALAALIPLLAAALHSQGAPPPLIAYYALDPDPEDPSRLVDSGPNGLHGRLGARVTFTEGRRGKALRFTGGEGSEAVISGGLVDRLSGSLSVTLWMRLAKLPDSAGFLAKRGLNVAAPFDLSIVEGGRLGFEGHDGSGWVNCFSDRGALKAGEWLHVAWVYQAGGEARWYVNGREAARGPMARALAANDQPLVLGRSPVRGALEGDLDEVRLYAAALSPDQVMADLEGRLETRAAAPTDFPSPSHPVRMALVRYDAPIGFQEGYGRTRREAQRRPGPDAVDWPRFTLDGRPLWEKEAVETVDLPLRDGDEARPLFRQPYDAAIQPGNHWLRAVQWLWGQRYAYTSDRTARSWHNDYELWAFPVLIRGAGAADVRDVVLCCDGRVIYENPGPLRSLTLLLPMNEPGKPYALTAAGRGPVHFNVGLRRVQVGAPREVVLPVSLSLPGPGPRMTVRSLERPEVFPHQREWDEDVRRAAELSPKQAADPKDRRPAKSAAARRRPTAPQSAPKPGLARGGGLGIAVPRSPLMVHAVQLPHGMSGGAFFSDVEWGRRFQGSAEEWARLLADTGYDCVFERGAAAEMIDALARHGIRYGLVPDTVWGRPFLSHPNVALFSAALPDWHAPLFRSLQLQAQTLRRYPSFAGFSIGADNGAYASFWDWAPPVPNRPWAEAYLQLEGGRTTRPLPGHLGGTASVRQFLDHVARYDETFRQYGVYARAVSEVDPSLVTTSGSFGSGAGVGARGGWPWGSVPGRPIFEGMPVQQAYDWNELSSSKPAHLIALIDRLRSYFPRKRTWAIVDDFRLFFGREARQRAYALALTRGVQAIGTNFLAAPEGPEASPRAVADQKELYAWLHRYGGVYAHTEPEASIGVLYVHPQALLRPVLQDAGAPDREVLRGSHEGKTTEALWLCHAAGWPARIVTPEELRRGLPRELRALLLVGLNRFDESWVWFEGLEASLAGFVKTGGRLLLDDESVAPPGVRALKTGLAVHAYAPQSEQDITPLLYRRNVENLRRLRRAMAGLPTPAATSQEPTLWAIPTRSGNTQYVTALNWSWEEGKSASRVVKPRVGRLTWRTRRPIYDVRTRKRLTPVEAARVDLTRDGFAWYALPRAEVTTPALALTPGADGFYRARVTISNRGPLTGIPVRLTVSDGSEAVEVYSATGLTAKLPIAEPGEDTVTCTELLTGRSTRRRVKVAGRPRAAEPPERAHLRAFAARRGQPLVVALTAAQAADPAAAGVARDLVALFRSLGRRARLGRADPTDVVRSLQVVRAVQRYPQWQTVPADLVLLGTPADNVLLMDQRRGGLLPDSPPDGLHVCYSPFVGDCRVLNVLGGTPAELKRAAAALRRAVRPGAPPGRRGGSDGSGAR